MINTGGKFTLSRNLTTVVVTEMKKTLKAKQKQKKVIFMKMKTVMNVVKTISVKTMFK